ncbi:unnamed protein product [Danaus chrysippus]|uniref:(African queen) hypothetical protein n=1 Tax=Danaus chrysippus TaxID=151541 RepID=A0A8J2QF86_9NEOP|nr:unnamed protein product [Danaus chrysippus]
MPILVKDYTWIQTPTNISIRVPLDPVYREKVDMFTADCYIKAHFSPYLLELFLLHDVNMEKSKCVVNNNMISMDLVKREEIDWENLEKNISKEEKKAIRQRVLEESQEKAKKEKEEKSIKKTELDRFTVQRAMDIDSKQHELMDSRRDEERQKAMSELEKWKERSYQENDFYNHNMCVSNKKSGVKIVELPDSDTESKEKAKDVAPRSSKHQLTPKSPAKTVVKSEYVDKKKQETATRVLPRLRQMMQLEITHTKRTFPTPSRESTAQEEEAWLKNITLARRATGFVSEDLRPEEQDPQWCKEKGDEFFRCGNFLGAISAYTHGITLSEKLPSLYANRAAAHFALGNFNKCTNDSSTALDLMKPACEGNRQSRAKCIARRAAALARMGYLNKAIDEMKAASKLVPEDEKIKKDIYNMERAWEQNPDSD